MALLKQIAKTHLRKHYIINRFIGSGVSVTSGDGDGERVGKADGDGCWAASARRRERESGCVGVGFGAMGCLLARRSKRIG